MPETPPKAADAPDPGIALGRVRWLLRRRWLIVALLLVSLPPAIYGAAGAWSSIRNDVNDWLPEHLPATQSLMRFVRLFGSDELLMISWDGASLDDPRLAEFRRELLRPEPSAEGPAPLFRSVLTGAEMLAFYQSAPLSMDRPAALDRMRRWILAPDSEETCLVAFVSRRGVEDREAAVDLVYDTADRVDGLSRADLIVAGPTIDSVAIDRASRRNLGALNLASFGVCLLILVLCQRHWRVAGLVFSVALFNELVSMAMIYFIGGHLDSVLLLAANLTFVLSISVGVHLVNYYRDALRTHPVADAPAWALSVALKPTVLATLTTAIGLASLQISETRPISRFGFFGALSVVVAATSTMILVAAHFAIWPLKADQARPQHGRGVESIVAALHKGRWAILLATLVGLLAGGVGVQRLKTSVGLHELIAADDRVVLDYERLEEKIGPLTPLEVVLVTPSVDARGMLEQFRAVAAVHDALSGLDPGFAVISTRTFSPPPPPPSGGLLQAAKSAVFRRTLLENQDRLAELGFLLVTPEHHYWRVTVRCPATRSLDFGPIIQSVESTVESVVAEHADAAVSEVLVGGGVPLVHQTQQQMLRDLIDSFGLAFGLVGVTLMGIFRSFACGLIGMIPNLLPCALAFGGMGFLGIPVELGTILTASAALGIAVDDTMHFVTWFRHAGTAGGGAAAADIAEAYRRCAPAMVQTTLVTGLGLLVFYFSGFLPISKFGLCMFSLLALALMADLVVLPAILLTPLGRAFSRPPDRVDERRVTDP
ncbi:MMPL family transporter [Botrimarina sp.]|uniref:efflux RND transporter permease subunit n=1 Tax=Botrimarina sp. TaxID=2795802 RepID=UPI0032EF607A